MASERPLLPDVRLALDTRFPHLVPAAVRSYPVGTVALGRSGQQPVALGRRPLLEHSHVIGTTGGGKTNFLEFLIRQVIKNGDGVCVIDPHGAHRSSLYNSLIGWLFAEGYHRKSRIHLIDPNAQSHVTGFNPLALPGPHTSVSVVADTTLEAFEKVWGDEETHGKPTIRRILKATFAALAELRLTLAEAELLLDHRDTHGVRKLALSKLTDRYARKVLADLDELAQADRVGSRFRDEIVGPINRLAEFTSAPAIRRIIGQREHAINLTECLDRGDIILVNLSGGDAVSDADTELLGRLLTRFIFFHVKRRRTDKPFWFFIDECQRYLSGDIPNLLAEARKFSCGVTLSHQWQSQLGKPEDQTLAAVHNATNLKVSFRVKHPKEAQEIAETIIPLDLERPVDILTKPTVVGHRKRSLEPFGREIGFHNHH
jgi:Helicase HerA, central domain